MWERELSGGEEQDPVTVHAYKNDVEELPKRLETTGDWVEVD